MLNLSFCKQLARWPPADRNCTCPLGGAGEQEAGCSLELPLVVDAQNHYLESMQNPLPKSSPQGRTGWETLELKRTWCPRKEQGAQDKVDQAVPWACHQS